MTGRVIRTALAISIISYDHPFALSDSAASATNSEHDFVSSNSTDDDSDNWIVQDYAYNCTDAVYALCYNANCTKSDNKTATCDCWIQNGSSILPATGRGASHYAGTPGGEELCEDMKSGSLWSTYGPSGEGQPGVRYLNCPSETPFAFCWGAICERIEDEWLNGYPKAECSCPVATSPGTSSGTAFPYQTVVIQEEFCDGDATVDDLCTLSIYNADTQFYWEANAEMVNENLCIESNPLH